MKLLPVDSVKARALIAQLLREHLLPVEEIDVNNLDSVPKFGGLLFPGARTKAAIQASIATIGSGASRGVYLSAGDNWALEEDLTTPASAHIEMEAGALIAGSGGTRTLTINGSFHAPKVKVFGDNLTVKFGPGFHGEVYPEWWGARADDSTECAPAVQAAIDSAPNMSSAVVKFGPGIYRISSTIQAYTLRYPREGPNPWVVYDRWGAFLVGSGQDITILRVDVGAANDGIVYGGGVQYAAYGGLRDLTLKRYTGASCRDMLVVENWLLWKGRNFAIYGGINGSGRDGCRWEGNLYSGADHSHFEQSVRDGLHAGKTRQNWEFCRTDMGTSYWGELRLGTGVAPVIERELEIAPPVEGVTVKPIAVTFGACPADNDYSGIYCHCPEPYNLAGRTKVVLTAAVYARVESGTATAYLMWRDNKSLSQCKAADQVLAMNLTTEWQRFTLTPPAGLHTDGAWTVFIGLAQEAAYGLSVAPTVPAQRVLLCCPTVTPGMEPAAWEAGVPLEWDTSCSFDTCHFGQNGRHGVWVGAREIDLKFYSPTIEGNANHGAEITDGSVTMIHPYFETNGTGIAAPAFDLHANAPDGLAIFGPQVHLTQPQTLGYTASAQPDKGGFRFERVRGCTIIGGNYSDSLTNPLWFDSDSDVVCIGLPRRRTYSWLNSYPVYDSGGGAMKAIIPPDAIAAILEAPGAEDPFQQRRFALGLAYANGDTISDTVQFDIEVFSPSGTAVLKKWGTSPDTIDWGNETSHVLATAASWGRLNVMVQDFVAETVVVRVQAQGTRPIFFTMAFAGAP